MDRPRLKSGILAAILILAAVLTLGGCGGGGTTTVIERTVTERSEAASPERSPAFLKLPTYEAWTMEPEIYSFGASGNPAGHDLVWTGWGTDRAEGRGSLWTRRFEGGNNPSDYDKAPATIVATALEECGGRRFYTRVEAMTDDRGSEGAVDLQTPCTGGAPFGRDALEQVNSDEAEPAPESESLAPHLFFHTPTENIGCALSANGVRCDIQEHNWQPPPKPADCDLDWGYGLAVAESEPGHFFCGGDSVFGVGGAVGYGQEVRRGDYGCAISRNGVRCENSLSGHGFVLSRQRARGF